MGKCYQRSERYRPRYCRREQELQIVCLTLRRTSVWRSSSFEVNKERARRRRLLRFDSHDERVSRSRVQKLNGLSSEEKAGSPLSLSSAILLSPSRLFLVPLTTIHDNLRAKTFKNHHLKRFGAPRKLPAHFKVSNGRSFISGHPS